MSSKLKLKQKGDAIFAKNGDQDEWREAKVVYARPVSFRDGQIAIVDKESKEEIAWLDSLEDLFGDSQRLALQALQERYPINLIESIEHTEVNHGHRYLKVMTNRGFRYFNLKEPGKNVTALTDDRLVIRDSMGNRYEIPSIAKLDPESRERLDRVL